MNEFQDAFISYGRADSKLFAKTLNDRLTELGYTIWFDFDDIPLGVDYQKQIDDAIAKSDNIIFVIAPHSINSPYCKLELDLATHYRKRIIPILHVEQIDQETWQRRNPGKPETDWQAYKATGKHSSFVNMHPEVSRINWIYMREEVDDFHLGLEGLVSVLNRQKAYVTQHTLLLDRAFLWQTSAKQSHYLLTGEELQDAEQWLKHKFSTEQPPCWPTPLHCEFISESLKYAQGGLTDVFLCYSDPDRSFAEQLRRRLISQGITVWIKDQDLVLGEDETIALKTGIEEACNFIYLLSQNSLDCDACLQSLHYADKLNKRIIPIKTTDAWMSLPKILENLNTINLADNLKDQDYRQDEADLIKILTTDEEYHQIQRDLLVRALKWERQNHNHSIVLRGNHLQKIQVWLNIALRHPQYPPSSLQIEFVKASLAEPEPECLDVFLYSTATDSDLGRRFCNELQLQGKLIYFNVEMIDADDVSVGSLDVEIELSKQIQCSSNCIFILSPAALIDPIFCIALDQAIDLNKRILFIEYRPIDANDLPHDIVGATFIPFIDDRFDFWTGFNQIMRLLEVDREYVQEHTRWLQRSLRWAEGDRSEDLLLRGNELLLATDWLNRALEEAKIPEVTALQQDLVKASIAAKLAAETLEQQRQTKLLQLQADRAKEAEARLVAEQKIAHRQKLFLVAVSTGLILSVLLTLLALWSYWRSVVKANVAEKREVEVLAELSNSQFATHQTLESLITAIQATRKLNALIPHFPAAIELKPTVLEVLQQAVYRIKEFNRLTGHQGRVYGVAISPNGRWIVSGGDDKIIRLWTHEGLFVKGFSGHQGRILDLAFSPDSKTIASSGTDGVVRMLRKSGRVKNTLAVNTEVFSLAFNPQPTAANGVYLVTAGSDGTLKLWSEEGTLLRVIEAHRQQILKIIFAHQSQTLWSASMDGTVKHWNLEDGSLMQTLQHDRFVNSLALTPDDRFIATGSGNGTLSLWDTTGPRLFSQEAHQSVIADLAFAPRGGFLASASWDNTMGVWQLDGTLISRIEDHGAPVQTLAFDPLNPQVLLSGSWDGTIRFWSGDFNKLLEFNSRNPIVRDLEFSADQSTLWIAGSNRQLEKWDWKSLQSKSILSGHNNDIASIALDPKGTWIATSSWDGRISLWTKTGEFLRFLEGHTNRVTDLAFTQDGQFLLSSSSDGTLKRWSLANAPTAVPMATIARSQDEINAFDVSADGQWIVTASADGQWQLLEINGEVVVTIHGHNAPVTDIAFLNDSEKILTASLDHSIKVWDYTGQLKQTLTRHQKGIPRLAIHPTATIFASASIDKTVRIWQLEGATWSPLTTIRGYRDGVLAVAFSPDGQYLATGDAGSQILVWQWQSLLNSEALLKQGCNWLKDYLNPNYRNPNRTPLEGIDPEQLCPGLESGKENSVQ